METIRNEVQERLSPSFVSLSLTICATLLPILVSRRQVCVPLHVGNGSTTGNTSVPSD